VGTLVSLTLASHRVDGVAYGVPAHKLIAHVIDAHDLAGRGIFIDLNLRTMLEHGLIDGVDQILHGARRRLALARPQRRIHDVTRRDGIAIVVVANQCLRNRE
jgi:hypothetical protein